MSCFSVKMRKTLMEVMMMLQRLHLITLFFVDCFHIMVMFMMLHFELLIMMMTEKKIMMLKVMMVL